MGVRELTCCRRRGERPLRLPVPWEPEVFLSILRERAGRLDMVSAATRALDSAMRWDYGRRRKLRGRCCLECCCQDRQLQADGGSFRSFSEFAEISMLLWLQGEARGAGAGARRCGGVAICSGVESRLPQHYRNRLEKFDWLRGVAAADAGSLARGQFDA